MEAQYLNDLTQSSLKLARARRYQDALSLLEQAIRVHPDLSELNIVKAILLARMDRVEDAMLALNAFSESFDLNAINTDPEQGDRASKLKLRKINRLIDRSLDLLKLGKSEQALATISRARELNLAVKDLELVYATCLLERNQVKEAKQALFNELSHFPSNETATQLIISETSEPRTQPPILIFPSCSSCKYHQAISSLDLGLHDNERIRFSSVREAVYSLRNIPCELEQGIKMISGQGAYFGIHRQLKRSAAYMTVFRNPVDRALDLFNESSLALGVSKKSHLKRALISFQEERNNQQIRLLLGPHYDLQKEITADDFRKAIRNFSDYFCFVGLAEFPVETSFLLNKILGRAEYSFCNSPSSKSSPLSREDLSAQIIDTIQESNQWDMALYEFASECFASRLESLDCEQRSILNRYKGYAANLNRVLSEACSVELEIANWISSGRARSILFLCANSIFLQKYAALIEKVDQAVESQTKTECVDFDSSKLPTNRGVLLSAISQIRAADLIVVDCNPNIDHLVQDLLGTLGVEGGRVVITG